MASGSNAMAGNGLNMAITVLKKSLLICEAVAHSTNTAASAMPSE